MRIDFMSPFVCETLVSINYVVKIAMKMFIGMMIGSISLIGDAVHNVSDLVSTLVVIYILHVANRMDDERYPVGQSNLEYLAGFVISILLFTTGVNVLGKSVLSLAALGNVAPALTQTVIDFFKIEMTSFDMAGREGVVLGLLVFSIVTSFVFSTYQIWLGKKLKKPGLVADGTETRVDMIVEIAIIIGVAFTLTLKWKFVDPLMGIVISAIIFHAAYELFTDSYYVLIQASIPAEKVTEICRAIARMTRAGGHSTEPVVKAYRMGKYVVVDIECPVDRRLSQEGIGILKNAAVQRIKELLKDEDNDLMIRFRSRAIDEAERVILVPVGSIDSRMDYLVWEKCGDAVNFLIVKSRGDDVRRLHWQPGRTSGPVDIPKLIERKGIDTVYCVGEEGVAELVTRNPELVVRKIFTLTYRDLFND